jgi:hypothetical protein
MSDSNLSRVAVLRMLHITRQSWLHAPAPPKALPAPSPRPISSHRLALQKTSRNRRVAWGLQPVSRAPCALES